MRAMNETMYETIPIQNPVFTNVEVMWHAVSNFNGSG